MTIDPSAMIDEPILGLVKQLNTHGIRTTFSCCGFKYENDGDRQHSLKGPYIAFLAPDPSDSEGCLSFLEFLKDCLHRSWTLDCGSIVRQFAIYYYTNDVALMKCAIEDLENAVAKRPTSRIYPIVNGYEILDEISL